MLDPGLNTNEMAGLFGPEGRVQALLEIEAVLAESQGELGLIPEESASIIAATCRGLEVDAADLLARGWDAGSPLLPLLELLRAQLPAEHREQLHRDTTTQDIVDTALCWRASQAIHVLSAGVIAICETCSNLADEHRHTWMTGRSFLQAARPTSFGARAALWLHALTGRLSDLASVRGRLGVQLGGPVGLGTSMGGGTFEVAALIGERLGLTAPVLPWQSDREAIVALGAAVASVARTSEKIAGDLMVMAQTEVGEVGMRPGGSSAMPHKENPVDAMLGLTAARVASGAAAVLLTSPPPRLERDAGSWQAEWHLIAETFGATAVSVQSVGRALATIEVDRSRMQANLDRALGTERPDASQIDQLIATAIAGFESRSAG